ncbi:hypothetical protein [Celeribacter ethanolicus]|uniref:hypothetical protein n=1 Tax=Celeribacter ethanolicus TaxID=1758178 RepID=UPI000835F637|nr:hypothetical protein [Celeribacter ethanolicus]
MAKVAVEFKKVRGSFVAGDRAAFSEEKVKELEKGGFLRRLTNEEVSEARAASVAGAPLDEVADLKERLRVAESEIAAARNAEAKAVKAAEVAEQGRGTALAQLAALKAEAAGVSQDAKADTETVVTTDEAKTEAAKATGTPPKQGATK